MHWIVNSTLTGEGGYYALIEQIERQGHAYTLVRKPPMVGYLVAMHDDLDEHGHNRPIMLEGIDGPVFVTGTTSMREVSAAHGWNPGYVDAPSQDECFAAWGDHMLNFGATFGTIADIVPPAGCDFFIRPNEDTKSFAGKVMEEASFADWRRDVLAIDTWTTIPPETRVMIAPLRTIWAEYRCIAVDGRYVTGSRYKTGRTVAYSPDVGDRIVRYVDERLAEWCPRRAMCVDVADTPDGLKVIETNSVSSAGFYCIDMEIFVREISAMAERQWAGSAP